MSNKASRGATARLAVETSTRETGTELGAWQWNSIAEILPDAVVVTSSEGRILLVNQHAEQLFGYARADLIGEQIERLIPEQFRATHEAHRAAYVTAPHIRPMGTNLQQFGRRRDGSQFPAEIRLSPYAVGGDPPAIIATIRDISERLQLESARAEAEAATEELRRVQAITDVALTHRSPSELLRALLDRICEVMQVENATVLLVDADAQVLTVRAAYGLEDAGVMHMRVPVGQGFAGYVAASRQPLVVDDLSTFPVFSKLLQEKLQSAIGVPLMVEDRLIGVVHIGSATPRHFTEREVRLLQLVAERIALAIDHAHLFEAEQAALARAQVSEARFHRLIESNIVGILIMENATVIEANDAFLQLVGYSHADLMAGRLRQSVLTPPEHRAVSDRAFDEALATGSCRPFEKEYLHRNGRRVPVLVGSVLLERDPVRLVGVVLDLTERKRLEREREDAQGRELAVREVNRHMDQFFATAAHDIRNPVTVVKGNVQLALRRLNGLQAKATGETDNLERPLATLRASLVDAQESVDRLTRIVARLFDVARARSGTVELRLIPCDLAAIVREQVAAQRVAAPDRTILLELPDAQPDARQVLVVADADRLAQVIANYVTNALKYSAVDAPVEVRLEVTEGLAVVSVRDEGPGLPLEEQVRVWEPFHRAPGVEVLSRTEGTGGSLGLGLHICKRIIELHSGRVGVESAVGQGSAFWFTLPLAAGAGDGGASGS